MTDPTEMSVEQEAEELADRTINHSENERVYFLFAHDIERLVSEARVGRAMMRFRDMSTDNTRHDEHGDALDAMHAAAKAHRQRYPYKEQNQWDT